MAKLPAIVVTGLRGRNTYDSPSAVPDDQCVEALNIDPWDGDFGGKRTGATALAVTFGSGGPFSAAVQALIRHVPGNDETAAELWAIDNTAVTGVWGRLAGGTSWTQVTIADNADGTTDQVNVVGATLDGKLFFCYNTAQNRLHVWDGSSHRRVGLATPSAPSTAEDGAGALSFTRYYRQRYVHVSGSDVIRISEASASTSRTISAKAGITITKASAISEGETHWDVEAADASTGPWYRIARTVVGTTTYDDTSATISTTDLSAEDGINYPPPSAKYIIATDARLIMAAAHETSGGYVTPKGNRLWYTPVIGSSDIGDSERIPTGNFLDVEGSITGLGQNRGLIYVFAYRRIWKLVPTLSVASPYAKYVEATDVGCIRHHTIVNAEDENGSPALYFLSSRGAYRIGSQGLQYLGADIENDIWAGVNLGASEAVAHGVYYAAKHQIWWWIATGSSTKPDTKIVFDTRLGRTVSADSVRGGWYKHTGNSAAAYCSVMFSTTVGASMSRDLKPYVGYTGASAKIYKCDSGATSDDGTSFQAYVETKEYTPAGIGRNIRLHQPSVIANAQSGSTITVTGRQDFGLRSDASGTVSLTAEGSETSVHRKAEGFQSNQLGTIAFRVGDTSANTNAWIVDALYAPYAETDAR